MVITSCRCLWKASESIDFSLQIMRGPGSLKVARKENTREAYWVLQVIEPSQIKGVKDKTYLFKFHGPQATTSSARAFEILSKKIDSFIQQMCFLGPDALEKLAELQYEPNLK